MNGIRTAEAAAPSPTTASGDVGEVVVLATSPERPDGPPGVEHLRAALEEQGRGLYCAVWSSPALDGRWDGPVLVCGADDGAVRASSFRAWMRACAGRLVNVPEVVRYGLDKSCLLDLADAGAPVHPTLLRPAGARMSGLRGAIVSKPRVGAFGEGLDLGSAGEWSPPQFDRIVQPYWEGITEQGEVGVVIVGGQIVGAVRRRPEAYEFRVGHHWGQRVRVERLCDGAIDAATAVLAALPSCIAYGRLDFRPDEWLLMDVELAGVDLHWDLLPDAARYLAEVLTDDPRRPTACA